MQFEFLSANFHHYLIYQNFILPSITLFGLTSIHTEKSLCVFISNKVTTEKHVTLEKLHKGFMKFFDYMKKFSNNLGLIMI
jgi:hypothetical protein